MIILTIDFYKFAPVVWSHDVFQPIVFLLCITPVTG